MSTQSLRMLQNNAAALPLAQPIPQPETGEATHLRQRAQASSQTHAILLILMAVLVFLMMGIVVGYGHALRTGETFRRVRLQRLLSQERERSRELQQLTSRMRTSDEIRRKAQILGMTQADPGTTVTIP